MASIITTTGFATTDFDQWPEFSKSILVILMFIGACAGSTGGGLKVSRVLVGVKEMLQEMRSLFHPQCVNVLRLEGKRVENTTLRSINAFFVTYGLIFFLSLLIVSLDNFDFTTNFTAVAATFNNIGPGLELVGPAANFSIFSYPAKLVLTFDMLAGRLEIFPLLLLFVRDTWKRF